MTTIQIPLLAQEESSRHIFLQTHDSEVQIMASAAIDTPVVAQIQSQHPMPSLRSSFYRTISYRTYTTADRATHAVFRIISLCVRALLCVIIGIVCTTVYGGQRAWAQTEPTGTPTATVPMQSDGEASEIDWNELERQVLDQRVEQYLSQMTTKEKVGQLFLLSFQGDEVGMGSDIATLICEYGIGGVVISPRNGNFTNIKNSNTPTQVVRLTNQLQSLAYGVDAETVQANGAAAASACQTSDIPLFIAVEQQGDNLPGTALREQFTELPSPMALGAAWDLDLTRAVGAIVGRELHAVGVNMLLGPNLDVFDQPRQDAVGSLGIYSFGGSPYWVGRMGQAYIAGVHEGSQNHVITVARHFPGQGDSDRIPEEEVATIQTSAEELWRTDLLPFLNITQNRNSSSNANSAAGITDALMTSHMRYSGIQGSVSLEEDRPTPISLDIEFNRLLESEAFENWRPDGLVVSNALGSPAIRRHYASLDTEFPPRQIALAAFNAGHDLLYLGQFSADGSWESAQRNISQTIDFFVTRYNSPSDADFAAQIDDSVRRILRAKLRMYVRPPGLNDAAAPAIQTTADATATITMTDSITATDRLTGSLLISPSTAHDAEVSSEETQLLDALSIISNTYPISLSHAIPLPHVLTSETISDVVGTEEARAIVGQVARAAVTLLYPEPNAIPSPPQSGDKLLIVTNHRLQRECEECAPSVAAVDPEAVQDDIVALYGIDATGQISEAQITSTTFEDLASLLQDVETDGEEETAEDTPTLDVSEQSDLDSPDAAAAELAAADAEQIPTEEAAIGKNARLTQHVEEADWIIFVMLDVNTARDPDSDVVKRFLREWGNRLSGKRVIVIALDAPYFLDATEISQLNAYFGAYSKIDPFIESVVRAMFKAYSPSGAAPVNVSGTRFRDLTQRLQPDPTRTLALELSTNGVVVTPPENGATDAADDATREVGELLRIQVGPVLDYNGHRVPDNTVIEFHLTYAGDESPPSVATATTHNGIATHEMILERSGILSIRATSRATGEDDAVASSPEIPITIRSSDVESTAEPEDRTPVATLTPELHAEETPLPADSTSAPAGPAITPPAPSESSAAPVRRVNLWTLMVALITIVVMLSLLLILQVHILEREYLVRNMLWAMIVGLFAYILYGVGMIPGAEWLQTEAYPWGTSVVVFIAMLFPLLWLQLRMQ